MCSDLICCLIGFLIGIVFSILIWVSFRLHSLNGKKGSINHGNNYSNEENSNGYNVKKNISQQVEDNFNRLDNKNSYLMKENSDLQGEIDELKLELKNCFDQIRNSRKSDLSEQVVIQEVNSNFRIRYGNERQSERDIINVNRIAVSFSFEEKNGTVKKDDDGDMYLEKSGDHYELVSEKEIYGTAIHLEQLQYNYKILNPDKANNKPMRVIKKPLYTFDNSVNKGFLIHKGEVEYQ